MEKILAALLRDSEPMPTKKHVDYCPYIWYLQFNLLQKYT